MSARTAPAHHPNGVHARTDAAIRCLVLRIGITETARLLNVEHSTISRRMRQPGGWPHDDILTLKRLERDLFQDRTIIDAEIAGLFGEAIGEPIAAVQQVTESMGLHGRIIALQARIIADGQVDSRDQQSFDELREQVAASHLADLQGLSSISARLRGGQV